MNNRNMIILLVFVMALVFLAVGCEEKRSGPMPSTIHDATEQGDLKAVKHFISQGVSINKPDKDSKYQHGLTPLHLASLKGHAKLVKFLIKKGAKVNAWDTFGTMTPLHLASSYGHFKCVKILVANGANVNAKSNVQNATPLYLSLVRKNVDKAVQKKIHDFLIEHGAK